MGLVNKLRWRRLERGAMCHPSAMRTDEPARKAGRGSSTLGGWMQYVVGDRWSAVCGLRLRKAAMCHP